MNKAKTLKRRLGNPKPCLECVLHSEETSELHTRFLSVAWDTDDIPDERMYQSKSEMERYRLEKGP